MPSPNDCWRVWFQRLIISFACFIPEKKGEGFQKHGDEPQNWKKYQGRKNSAIPLSSNPTYLALSQNWTPVSRFSEQKMLFPTSFRVSRDERSTSPMRVPRTIGKNGRSSAGSLCSDITLDDALFSTVGSVHHSPKSTSASTTESQRKGQQRNHQKYNGSSSAIKGYHQRKKDNARNHRVLSQEEIEHHCTKRMELPSSSNRDFPPKNPKTLQRRCTDPLPMGARKACLQDLGYLERDGRKTALVKRFLQLRSTPPFERAASDESYSSMPLRMPIRKASMEETRMGCSPPSCSQQALPQPRMNKRWWSWYQSRRHHDLTNILLRGPPNPRTER